MLPLRYFALLGLLLTTPAAGAQPFFDAPWHAYSTGTYQDGRHPVTFTTADFDGDGHIDVAVGHNVFASGIRLLMNDGTGAYVTGPTLPLQRGTWDVAAADLNGDGHVDVVASDADINYTGNTVAVFLNNGDGTFGPRQSYVAGEGPTGVVAADLNGDGHLDLAVTNYGYIGQGTTVSVLLNDGTGAFGPAASHAVPSAPYRIEAGDLDGDGRRDLVVAHDGNRASVLRNLGGGTFGAAQLHTVTVVPPSGDNIYPDVSLADVDGDGDLDVLFANTNMSLNGHTAVVLFRNDGSGALSQQAFQLRHFGPSPVDVETPDLNGDGSPDLLVAGYLGPTDGILVSLNDGSGNFGPAELYAAGEATFAVASADVDGDGVLDALTLDRAGRLVTVHKGLGDGTFPERPIYGDMFIHQTLDLGDIDGDGDLDAVTGHNGAVSSAITVLRNDGSGAFTQVYSTPAGGYAFGRFADLNGDGRLDLLFMSGRGAPPYDVFVAFGNGNGTFGAIQTIPMNSCGWGSVEAFDLDADGHLDIVASEMLGCFGDPNSAKRLFIRLNNGDGTFGPLSVIETTPAPRPLAAGDFDGDGHLDLAVGGARVALHYGNGDGTFRPFQSFGNLFGPQVLIAADFDGDGRPDVAVGDRVGGSFDAGALVVMRGRGDGTLDPAVVHPVSGMTFGLAAGDVDADGHLDLMLSGSTRDAVVFLNDGSGQFAPVSRPGVARAAWHVQFADVTGDGIGDLVAVAQQEVPAGGFGSGVVVVAGLTGTPPAPVAVSAVPVSPPVVIGPSGGSFTYRVTLTNTTSQTQTFQAWTAVTGPVGREPVVGPKTVTLPPGRTVTKTLTQQVPGNAPAGTYTYHVRVGSFPAPVSASDSFTFQKQGAAREGAPSDAAEGWAVSGWDEAAAASATAGLPGGFALGEAYPNPFARQATLSLEVAEAQHVTAEAYDALGRRVAVLLDGEVEAGVHTLVLDGAALPAGVYVVRVSGEALTATRRATLVR